MPIHVVVVMAALSLAGLLPGAPAAADPFRVCADPDNLPFTSADPGEKGMYLELADLLAARLGTTAEPVFFPTGPGQRALRPTLLAGRCDAFVGMPYVEGGAPSPTIRLTRPFQEIGYAVVAPAPFALRRLEDLDGRTVGVEFASTAQTLLSVRDRVRLVTFKTATEAMDALGSRVIDTAFVWGPVAGYRAARAGLLGSHRIVSVTGFGLRGRATIGVRASDHALRERLDREIDGLQPDLRKLADKYHFPLDEPVDLERAAVAEPPAAGAEPAPAPVAVEPSREQEPATARVNPFSGDASVPSAGRTLFNVHCSHCHSPNAQSPDPVRDLRRLHARYGSRVNEVFYATVTQGRPAKGMPPWGAVLNEETIWRIKTFLESVQAKPEP